MKRLTLDLDDQKHAQLKSKTAAAGVSMRDILDAAIDDYLAGKWRPKSVKSKGSKPMK